LLCLLKKYMRFLVALISRVFLLSGFSLLLLNPAYADDSHGDDSTDLRSPRTLKEANLTAHDLTPLLPATQPVAVEPTPADSETSTDSPSTVTYRPLPTQMGASFTTGPGVGYESSFGSIEGFVPLVQTPGKEIGYVQGRLNLDTAADLGGNLLFGYRAFNPTTSTILGGYLGFDIRSTGNQTVSQLGAGIEAILPTVELRLNGYLPVGNRSREIASSSVFTDSITATSATPQFQGNFLVVGGQSLRTTQTTRLFEDSLAGFDAEAGVKVVRWSPVGTLKSYLGLYYYGSPRVDGFVGVRGRLEARINENFRAGLSIQGDREFGTTAAVNVAFSFPGIGSSNTAPPQLAWAEAGNFVFRQNIIAVTQRRTTEITTATTPSMIALLNPGTNQPWFFQHVFLGGTAGSGTFESPFSTVQDGLTATRGDRNDIVYVQAGTNPGIPAFPIPANVQVLSNGVTQQIQTVQQGLTTLPLSGSGILPKVTGTVTLGNTTTLAGFNITPPINTVGIRGNGVQNVTVRQNRVTVAGDNTRGISLQNVTGTAAITGNTVATNGFEAHGIFLAPTANSFVTTAIVSDNIVTTQDDLANGILINSDNNSAIAALTVSGNTVTTSGDLSDGIALLLDNNSSITTATVSGNTVRTIGDDANGINTALQGGSSIASFSLTNNQIPESGFNNVQISNFGGQTLCTSIQGNLAQNPGFGGVNFSLSSGGALFQVIDLPNVNTTNNGGSFAYDAVALPTANFVNVLSCP
jgi:hypothetical protein